MQCSHKLLLLEFGVQLSLFFLLLKNFFNAIAHSTHKYNLQLKFNKFRHILRGLLKVILRNVINHDLKQKQTRPVEVKWAHQKVNYSSSQNNPWNPWTPQIDDIQHCKSIWGWIFFFFSVSQPNGQSWMLLWIRISVTSIHTLWLAQSSVLVYSKHLMSTRATRTIIHNRFIWAFLDQNVK